MTEAKSDYESNLLLKFAHNYALLPSRELSIVSISDSLISMSFNVLVLVDIGGSLIGVMASVENTE